MLAYNNTKVFVIRVRAFIDVVVVVWASQASECVV